ncbi:MAG: amino acid adenylation domain-containing protein [Kangiella sp.]|nr:amino acid adenylation domain-containing protein [Kangiella sp.]
MSAESMDTLTPATSTQKGLYFIQKSNPQTSAYNLVFSARVMNNCNTSLLQDALLHIQRQHSVLHSVFCQQDDDIYYKATDIPLNLQVVDLSDLEAVQAREHIMGYSQLPFDLDNELAMRCYVFRLNTSEQVLLLVAHHASFDFWSLGLFLNQLASSYAQLAEGQALSLAFNCEYPNYLQQMSEYHVSEQYQSSVGSLAKKIADADSVLNLSTDYPRPVVNPFSGSSIEFRISQEITEKLFERSKQLEVTPYTLLLASYALVLHRYTGQSDILIGTPVAGRDRRKYHKLMGNFVNTIALHSSFESDSTVAEFIDGTAQRIKSAIKAQHVAFPDLVSALHIKPDPSRSALVQAGFAWDKLPGLNEFSHFFNDTGSDESITWGDLELTPYWLPQQEGQYDINIEMGAIVDGELCVSLKYRNDLFSPKTIHQFGLSFTHMLDQLLEQGSNKVCSLNLLPELHAASMQSVIHSSIKLDSGNDSIIDLIEKSAKQYPDNIAVQDESSSLTYKQLVAQSSQLAVYLQREHNLYGGRIGVSLGRDTDLVTVLLAILKCGASYVPIDPALPKDRAQMIIEDGELSVIINDAQGHFDQANNVISIGLEQLQESAATIDADLELSPVSPESTAYVIFTSGSTGRPKGVEVSHANVVNMLRSFAQSPGMDHNDSLLAVTTISFDISVLELFLPLSVGATIIILDSTTSADGAKLVHCLTRFDPSWMQATPATWKMLLDSDWQGSSKLTILCGGESLPKSLAEKLLTKCASLFNVYGPTETTVWSTFSQFKGGSVDIGHPIANTSVMIMDKELKPVPIGVVGDIYISGAGVTKGYFNRPDLTAKAYQQNESYNEVLYKTGDLGRLTQDGRLECLGRSDNQLKIRGFRIELSDVEENLRKVYGIKDAAVTAELVNGELTLIAYYVPQSDCDITDKSIKAELKQWLPYYMIPGFISALDSLPLNPNGKVDRKRLPPFSFENIQNKKLVQPRNDTEHQLLALWKDVLGHESISIDDDFYDIGGHSLMAMKLMGRINDTFELTLTNQFIFTNATIELMAAAINDNDFGTDDSIIVPLNTGKPDVSPLHLLHPIGGTVHCYMALNQYLDKDIPVYAYQSPGIQDADEIEVGIESIASKYVEKILLNQSTGPFRLGGWCFGGVLAYEAASQLQALGHEIEMIHVFDTRAPIVANHPSDGDDATLLSWFARDLAVPHNKVLDIPVEVLREIDPEEQFEYVLDRARDIGVVDAETDLEGLLNFFQVYIANGMALQMYEEKSYDLDVCLYRADSEPEDYGEYLGWDQILSHQFAVVDIPGDHNSIMYKPNVEAIARHLNQSLITSQKEVKKAS